MLRFFVLFSLAFLLLIPGIADAQKKTTSKKKPVKKTVQPKSKTTTAKKTTRKKTVTIRSKRTSSKGRRVTTRRRQPATPVYEAPAYFEPPYNPPLDERPIPKVLTKVDEMPEFDGDLHEYLRYSIHYPDTTYLKNKESTVEVKFIVTILGDIRNVTVVKPDDPLLDKEALRVVKEMPRWKPGRHKGMYANVYYTLPISLRRN